ncbi:MAG: iron chelate uptake ABC transporter family permease subunit [Propionicimonas sp.]|uniref:FecCD family ABC transporter permease n=1 Tax=Propionicimonas sp. TaxID=1955623 RepID=UPI002B1F541B|nr:iron chelate uptake ABC transporter family permease subunit [Propionicimonas sp.]MEA4943692.1 iron chelate uptake ABC transporter family permease subunit [Propionicimonas sp.]MEA5119242.1 iron chelate uptake ABC transporter family permease subunit [Propionicimonas sp.]
MSTPPLAGAPSWPGQLRPVRIGSLSGLLDVRATVWTLAVALVALAVGFGALAVGSSGLGLDQVMAALRGTADPATTRIVVEWRLSRVVFALLGGAALAVGGAVFQAITRNPLGSPDIVGFSTGAYTGALLVALAGLNSALATSVGALAGGLLTGVAVYGLAYRRGVTGSRVIVVGIGVSLFLGAFNTWVLTTMKLEQAISAASWGAGSLNDIGWLQVWPLAIGLLLVLPVVLWLGADLRALELGDDTGRGLGVPAEPVRATLLLAGIALVALVTAAAGPIAFVALAAPQLALRATRTPGVRVLPSAAFGALLLVVGDLIARTIIAPAQLPVGVVTLCLGGGYLVWLLAGFGRKALQ